MIGLSKKLMLSITVVCDIADNAANRPVRSKSIYSRHGIPHRYLEPVLQELVREGILVGMRGPAGGYRLGLDPTMITLARIAHAVENTSTAADIDGNYADSPIWKEIVLPLADDLATKWTAALEKITIDDLCPRGLDQTRAASRPSTHARTSGVSASVDRQP
jgi:Rrf2 family iron-sulfur cluster assembly transcriptional regulator